MKTETSINHSTANDCKPHVMPRFLPQPSEIERIMKERFEARKITDEFGWTGEWRMSAKDVLDVIINLQNEANLNVMSDFYTDGIDHSNLEVNSHEYPENEECVSCGSTSVTITDDKDICHNCGYVYE